MISTMWTHHIASFVKMANSILITKPNTTITTIITINIITTITTITWYNTFITITTITTISTVATITTITNVTNFHVIMSEYLQAICKIIADIICLNK